MNTTMILIGAVFGIAFAWGLYQCFRLLRQFALLLIVVVGWITAAIALYFIATLIQAYLEMRNDPGAPMGPAWGFLALLLIVVVLICAGIALYQGRIYQIGWMKAFAVLMMQAGVVTLMILGLQESIYVIADIIRGGNGDIPEILKSYGTSRLLVTTCEFTMMGVLLLLEGLYAPLISRKKS